MNYTKFFLLIFLFLFLYNSNSLAQSTFDSTTATHDETPWYFQKKTIATTGIAAHTVFTFLLEYSWWWKGNYHSFRYENDGFWNNYSLGVDKIGHFYTTYFYYNSLREILVWGGYSQSTAEWWSAGISLFYALSIEIGDGYSTYAFSLVDFTANTLGFTYGFLQNQVPFLQNFKFKWSYYPSGHIPLDRYFRLTDDYDGHIYWMSIDVHNLLPESWKSYWPKFLNIAIGYSGENIYGRPSWAAGPAIGSTGIPVRKFAISLDYNLSSITTTSKTWTALKNISDLFHYPAPGARFVQSKPPAFKTFLLN